MIIDQLRLCLRTSVSHQAPSSTVRIPHICVLLVCAFFTTPPCVCQHNLWHCHVTVCATIMSQTKVLGRDPTPSYRGGSAIRQQTRQESFCTLSIENRFKSASSQEHFSPRSCSWVGHGRASRVLWVRACKEPLMGHLRTPRGILSHPAQDALHPRPARDRFVGARLSQRFQEGSNALTLWEVSVFVCVHMNIFVFVCLSIPVCVWWVQVSVWCVYLPVVWPSLIPLSYLGSRLGATFPQVWSGITRLFDDKHFRWRNLLCAKVLYSRDRNLLGGQFFTARFDEKNPVLI